MSSFMISFTIHHRDLTEMKEGTEIYFEGWVKYHDGLDREAKGGAGNRHCTLGTWLIRIHLKGEDRQ